MPFFKRGRSASPPRPVSPIGASRYEQPFVPATMTRRTPPRRTAGGPENLAVSEYDLPSFHRRSPPHRTSRGPQNLQDLSSLGGGPDSKPQTLTRHRPRTSQGNGRMRRESRQLITTARTYEEPDFSSRPAKIDELDAYGSHARPSTSHGSQPTVSAGRSILRSGPQRVVKVVDTSVVEKLRPGYAGEGRKDSEALPRRLR